MALLKTYGIVFRRLKYGETSLIADIYTESEGLHSFIAGGVRKAKSQMPLPLFQPMMPVEIVAYFKGDAPKLHRLKEIRAALIQRNIPFDFRRGSIALFMAEICQNTVKETEGDPDLFSFLLEYVSVLDKTEQPLANLHLHFMAHMTKHLGFWPAPRKADEAFFDLKEGSPLASPPMHEEFMSGDAVGHFYALLALPLEKYHTLALGPTDRKVLLQHLLKFYRFHSPNFKEIQTPKVLNQLFE